MSAKGRESNGNTIIRCVCIVIISPVVFVVSFCLFACSSTAPTRLIYVKLDIGDFVKI